MKRLPPAGSIARISSFLLLAGLTSCRVVTAASTGQETAMREFQKTLPLAAGQTFSIESKFGEIRIHGSGSRDVAITATIHSQAPSQAEAEKFAESVHIDVQQVASGINVRTVVPSEPPVVIRIGRKSSYSVDYDIAVPEDGKLWVKNAFGDVEIRGFHGWSDLETSHGQLTIRGGGSAKLTNAFGPIEAEDLSGDLAVMNNNGTVNVSTVQGNLDLKDRFGSVTVRNVNGGATISGGNGPVELTDAGSSKVNNSFGTVSIRNIHGSLTVSNNNGSIDVNTVSGSADLNGSFGSVTFANVGTYVNCTASNGRVTGGPTGGDVFVRTSFGDVSLEEVSGSVDVEDSNGGITVREVKGKSTLKTSFGSIQASGLRKHVKATTGNGRISLTDVGGDAYAKTSFGAVTVERVDGQLTIENSNGLVTASSIKGDASAKTSFGAVTLDDISGSITVDNQNGAVMLSAARTSTVCKHISVKTSFAPIQVRLPEGAGYNITAHTSFGRISSDLPVTSSGQLGGDSLNGKIGNGGCTLSLTNSNGSIEILKLSK